MKTTNVSCSYCKGEIVLTTESAHLRWRSDTAGNPGVDIYLKCPHCNKMSEVKENDDVYQVIKARIDKLDFDGHGPLPKNLL